MFVAGYGDKELQTLVDHFQPLLTEANVNNADAELEWSLVKKDIHDRYSTHVD